MATRQELTRKLRELGYRFDVQFPRVVIWRKPGSTHRVPVPRRDRIEDAEVRSILRQCGCNESEITDFLESGKT